MEHTMKFNNSFITNSCLFLKNKITKEGSVIQTKLPLKIFSDQECHISNCVRFVSHSRTLFGFCYPIKLTLDYAKSY